MAGQLLPSHSPQGDPPAASPASSPTRRPNGNVKAADPMTAFWLAVKAKGISREQGQAILHQAEGDAATAITQL